MEIINLLFRNMIARMVKWYDHEEKAYRKLAMHLKRESLKGKVIHVTDYIKEATLDKMKIDGLL